MVSAGVAEPGIGSCEILVITISGRIRIPAPVTTIRRKSIATIRMVRFELFPSSGEGTGGGMPADNPAGTAGCWGVTIDSCTTGEPQLSQNFFPSDNAAPHAVQYFGAITNSPV